MPLANTTKVRYTMLQKSVTDGRLNWTLWLS